MEEKFNMILERINEGFVNQERIWRKEMEIKRKYREQMVN